MTRIDVFGPIRDLAAGWVEIAKDLDVRAANCQARAIQIRNAGDDASPLLGSAEEFESAMTRNLASARVYESAARQLLESVEFAERIRKQRWAELSDEFKKLQFGAVDTMGNPR